MTATGRNNRRAQQYIYIICTQLGTDVGKQKVFGRVYEMLTFRDGTWQSALRVTTEICYCFHVKTTSC